MPLAPLKPLSLESRLRQALDAGNAPVLRSLLLSLRNKDAHEAGRMLSTKLLPALSAEAYWMFFATVVPAGPKAFLGTFLRAAEALYRRGRLAFPAEPFSLWAEHEANVLDATKTLRALLPLVRTPEEADYLLTLFQTKAVATGSVWNDLMDALSDPVPLDSDREECVRRTAFLLEAATAPAYYLLFRTLKTFEADRNYLRRCARLLIRRADGLSFNLAAVLQAYYDLPPVAGSFSLSLAPYQLSRLDISWEAFKAIVYSQPVADP